VHNQNSTIQYLQGQKVKPHT